MVCGARWLVLLAAKTTTSVGAVDTMIRHDFSVLANGTYMLNMMIGTPPQQVSVDLDFGSADLRVQAGPNTCSTGCDPNGIYMTYNPNDSSTYESNQSYSSGIRASDGSSVAQEWAWDDVFLAGQNLTTVLAIGLEYDASLVPSKVYQSQNLRNLLGLGPRALEACVISAANGLPFPSYDNLIYQLKRANLTQSASFSIWVDPTSRATGRLLFGAVDDSLHEGPLHVEPIVNFPNEFEEMLEPMYLGLPLTAVNIYLGDSDRLDYSSSLIYTDSVAILNSRLNFSMPQPWLAGLGAAVGGVWSDKLALYFVSCGLRGTLQLVLNNSTLEISLEEFVIPSPGSRDANGQPLCLLEIEIANEMYLSNKVLQKYYLVVDYDRAEISFASAAAATAAPEVTPVKGTSETHDRSSLEANLDSEAYDILTLSKPASTLSVPASVSQAYLLGGTPEPTRMTGTYQAGSKQLPKATEASNAAVKLDVSRVLGILWYIL